MKFKIDENLPVEFTDVLKLAGHKAMTVMEQKLQGKADSEIIDKCSKENCILVTLDLDFADIKLYPPQKYPGFIVLRVKRQDKCHLNEVFKNVIPVLKQEQIKGRLWIAEETRIRISGEDK